MKSFLDEVAKEIINSGHSFKEIKIIVPSKRATLFLKNSISNQINRPAFAPEIISIETFVEEISGLKKSLHVDLIYMLYSVYKDKTTENNRDTFDQFLGWSKMILSDFNQMDAYLVDQKTFFDFQFSLEELQQWAKKEDINPMIKNQLEFWRQMPELYSGLKKLLWLNHQGTSGMLFREAVNNLEHYLQNNTNHHYFVGFNALNEAEELIIQEFLTAKQGNVIWDIDRFFYEDKVHSAGKFIRKYYRDWKTLRGSKVSLKDNFSQPKVIEMIGVSKNITQAKYAGQLATELSENFPDERTAVVLGNEALLIPTLSAISDTSFDWNVTMGLPIPETSVSTFFEAFFNLHINASKNYFFYKDLKALISSPWCMDFLKSRGFNPKFKLEELEKKNLYRFQSNYLFESSSMESINYLFFGVTSDMVEFLNRCIQICEAFIEFLDQSKAELAYLDRYCFQRFKEIFNQMISTNQSYNAIQTISTLLLLLREVIRGEKINFFGEPLEGIQFMGLLETRLLDFENLIITNVNEGILPSGKKHQSFLPFDLKKKFNLPTFLENDAIYTYHFYRLLQRSKRVFLLYNTESEGLNAGEKSRFLYQLKYHALPTHQILEKKLVVDYRRPLTPVTEVAKTDLIMDRLKRIAKKGFSPSSLSLFLKDPLNFYHQRVLGIRENQTLEVTINNMDKGNLVHEVLETLYLPYHNKILKASDFDEMRYRLFPIMEDKYQSIYYGNNRRTGRNYIIFEVLKKSILDFLAIEEASINQGNEIKILDLEKPFEHSINIPELDFPIKLIGIVDRMDQFNGALRIIDYKTGLIQPKQLRLKDWKELRGDNDLAYLFQILIYSYVHADTISRYKESFTGIISFRNLPEYFMPFELKIDQSYALNNDNLNNFEKVLFELIGEIFNSRIPFKASI
jgi:hypothetical protein